MASYNLTTRSVAVPCRSVEPLSMACSCADNTAAALLIWIFLDVPKLPKP
jgi:hypothetical protein